MKWKNIPWSVGSEVSKDIADWTAFNVCRRKLKLPFLSRDLILYTEHPIRLCASLVLLAAAAVSAVILWTNLLSVELGEAWTKFPDRLGYFTTILAVQATIAALVYPIVIAFVTIFLQKRPATQALLQLYIINTGALVAGLSSLALVVVMSGEYVVLAALEPKVVFAITGVNAVWFLGNSLLTTLFLYRTIDFLRPEVQRLAIHRYTANVALPRDIEHAHLRNLFSGVSENNWVPLPNTLQDPSPEGPQIQLGGWFPSKSEPACTVTLHRPSVITDLRLWPLHVVLSGWARKAALVVRQDSPNNLFDEGWVVPTV